MTIKDGNATLITDRARRFRTQGLKLHIIPFFLAPTVSSKPRESLCRARAVYMLAPLLLRQVLIREENPDDHHSNQGYQSNVNHIIGIL